MGRTCTWPDPYSYGMVNVLITTNIKVNNPLDGREFVRASKGIFDDLRICQVAHRKVKTV
jgi:hypothetical protein